MNIQIGEPNVDAHRTTEKFTTKKNIIKLLRFAAVFQCYIEIKIFRRGQLLKSYVNNKTR